MKYAKVQKMTVNSTHTRRDFILAGTVAGAGLLWTDITGVATAAENRSDQPQTEKPKAGEEISPAEDLMREHGVLERILLIYEESIRRLNNKNQLEIGTLSGAAKIVRSFVEDYHSKLEEDHIFPCFEKTGKLVDLVKVLRGQHQAGRLLTDQILQLTVPNQNLVEAGNQKLLKALNEFIRMYRPHVAREDTVVFPAIRSVTTPEQFDAMGDQFEELEHKLFGQLGFENVVDKVAGLEKTLGIYDLSKFTAE